MKVDLSGLMVDLGSPKKLIPINSISLIEPVSDYYSNVYFKKNYSVLSDNKPFITINMSINEVQSKINTTIIKANKQIKEEA